MSDDPLALLRAATRSAHDAVETSGWLERVTREPAAYAKHLLRVASFEREAARALAPFAETFERRGFAPAAFERERWIGTELDALGLGTASLPHAVPFPELASFSAAAGALYVLEGSTLGGLVIARTVREQLDWESAYYHGRGPRTAEMWRAFGAALRACAQALDPDALVAGANATFRAYGSVTA